MKCCGIICLDQPWGYICSECESEYSKTGVKKDIPKGYYTSAFGIPIPKSKFYRLFSLKEQQERRDNGCST